MYGVQDKINQILRGAETICKNNMTREIYDRFSSISCTPSHINKLYQELAASKAEVERLKGRMKEAEDLIQRGQAGWEKEREFHRKTSENAGREISNLKAIENNLLLDVHTLHTKNVCLQELIQEFYEWSRRDFPTEQEVREIMNRYHNLLNK